MHESFKDGTAVSAGETSERKLDRGWAAMPGVRVRQAGPADMDAVRELSLLAGVTLEDELISAVIAGSAGQALRAGLRGGSDEFTRHLAGQFATHADQPLVAYLSAALILVADHRDHGITGALVAYPPPNIAELHVDARSDSRERQKMVMLGAIGAAKVKAVAVAEQARGKNIGGALLQRCKQVYFACGYVVVYGTMAATPGLPEFYLRNGFQVLGNGEGLDLWAVFGTHSHLEAGTGERFFIRYKPSQPSLARRRHR
jgi:GNAT superfamily N-acetyltransferase